MPERDRNARRRRFAPHRPVSGAFAVALLVVAATPAALADPDAAHPLDAHLEDTYRGTLKTILERRYIRVLTSRNSFDYFISNGRHRGFQYEMVKAFVKKLNAKYPSKSEPPIRFELLPVSSDELIPALVAGRGDLIAARLTITDQRKKKVAFSKPYDRVDEVLITHLDPEDFDSLDDLGGRQIAVRRASSYNESLVDLNRDLRAVGARPIDIVVIDAELETDAILELVSLRKYDFTVADSQLGVMATEVFEGLRMVPDLRVRSSGKIAWATHPESPKLLDEIDAFVPTYRKGTLLGNMNYKRYFRDFPSIRERLVEDRTHRLSRYDDAFREYAEQYGFDWRLMAAMAYQESRFRQDIKNRWGAVGLFQIKAETAREPYIDIPDIAGERNAANNVHAGIKYLAWIKQRYFDPIQTMEEKDRIRMALAAYNAGPATVRRGRDRARKMGLDPDRWFRNVEAAMLAMKRVEPVNYVSEINQRYVSYVLLGVGESHSTAPARKAATR